jgi:O-antigen ligase
LAAKDKIFLVVEDFLDRGFSDNGRFNLWRAAFDAFLKAPMFGSGFYGLHVEGQAVFGPLPVMAHNTVLELLSAMGIFGLFAYAYYRIKSLWLFFEKPSLTKSFLGMSVLVILLESLLDNFVFNVYPMFYIMAAMAIVFKVNNQTK